MNWKLRYLFNFKFFLTFNLKVFRACSLWKVYFETYRHLIKNILKENTDQTTVFWSKFSEKTILDEKTVWVELYFLFIRISWKYKMGSKENRLSRVSSWSKFFVKSTWDEPFHLLIKILWKENMGWKYNKGWIVMSLDQNPL